MKRTAILNVVGLSRGLLGPKLPRLAAWARAFHTATIEPAFPAVTCTAQANYATGKPPAVHGIVANGWYDSILSEVHFWKQSNHLVGAPKLWDELKRLDPRFTCAKLFWWYNMYSTADLSITPRPMYPADGRKFFDIYAWPSEIRPLIKKDLGEFPFAGFWGPAAGVPSPQGGPSAATQWIADSARWIEKRHSPTLSLVYLPHLDYNLQRLGPHHPNIHNDYQLIDQLAEELIQFYASRGVQVVLLSEYGISPVDTPIHINRIFRKQGWITVREELDRELLDPGNSLAFAVADHQIAHIYVRNRSLIPAVQQCLRETPGVDFVLDEEAQTAQGLRHPRAGNLIAVANENAWFTYYYWDDDTRAPDFARTVDIHRKPGYDPVELFLDPKLPLVKARIGWRLLQKKLGFRMLMDVIPLDASLVRGSHGCRPRSKSEWPVIVSPGKIPNSEITSTQVYDVLRAAIL